MLRSLLCRLHNLHYFGIALTRSNRALILLITHLKPGIYEHKGVHKYLELNFTQKRFLKPWHKPLVLPDYSAPILHSKCGYRPWISQHTAARTLMTENTAVPWFMLSVSRFSPRRSEFIPSLIQVAFVADKVAMRQSLHQVFSFLPSQCHVSSNPGSFFHISQTLHNISNWQRR